MHFGPCITMQNMASGVFLHLSHSDWQFFLLHTRDSRYGPKKNLISQYITFYLKVMKKNDLYIIAFIQYWFVTSKSSSNDWNASVHRHSVLHLLGRLTPDVCVTVLWGVSLGHAPPCLPLLQHIANSSKLWPYWQKLAAEKWLCNIAGIGNHQ